MPKKTTLFGHNHGVVAASMMQITGAQKLPITGIGTDGNGTGVPLNQETFKPENERTLTGGAVQPPPHAIDHD